MKHATEPVSTAWSSLDDGEKVVRLHRARQAWREASPVSWSDLTEQQQRFAAVLLPMVEATEAEQARDPIAGTVSCPECRDGRLVVSSRIRLRIFGAHRRESLTGAWFCQTCAAGLAAEAGYWRDRRTPLEGRRRSKSTHGWEDWHEYQRSNPIRARRIEVIINSLIQSDRQKGEVEE